jgi:hypothetical protein
MVQQAIGLDPCDGPRPSADHNLKLWPTCSFTAPSDQSNTHPLWWPLPANGGPTLTQALLFGSPAIDARDRANCPDTDQRGVVRPQGASCDIGAYESQSRLCRS